jgi:hypothetical protein
MREWHLSIVSAPMLIFSVRAEMQDPTAPKVTKQRRLARQKKNAPRGRGGTCPAWMYTGQKCVDPDGRSCRQESSRGARRRCHQV